jgi:hypothetical protein
VELLNLVYGPDGDGGVRCQGETVLIGVSVQRAHVLHLLQNLRIQKVHVPALDLVQIIRV